MATYEELAKLEPGEAISLDLFELWESKYDRVEKDSIALAHEGHLLLSPNESYEGYEDEEVESEWYDPYIDLYTDKGPVACDGETCDVISVTPDAETIELRSHDYDEPFTLAFEDAAYCVRC